MPSAFSSERYAAVVEVLAQARREAGLTQVQLAARLGRPQSYVSNVERRERRVDLVDFYDWAVAIREDPRVLFDRIVARLASRTAN